MAHHHGHSHHHHGHHHSHHHAPGSEKRLGWSIALNLLITIAEVVGGLLSGSLALLSDALHNFSDTASLGISLVARRMSRRAATQEKTFGYKRAEIIGAFVNLITLVLIAVLLIKEAVERLLEPQTIDGLTMLVVAVIGLLANVITAVLLYRDSKDSLNIRSAFLHIVADAVSSVGVVLGGLLIMFYNIPIVDALLTVFISLYILWHSYGMLRETVDILMEGTPKDLNVDHLLASIQEIDHVLDMHHLHVWQLDEQHTALEAHIVIDKAHLEQMETIKQAIKTELADHFGITHSTLEFELIPCGEADADCFEQMPATAEAVHG